MRAELFINLGSSRGARSESPPKRSSVLPPSVNLAAQNSQDGGLPPSRGRSQADDNLLGSRGDSRAKSGASPAPGTSPVHPKARVVELPGQQPPQREEDPIEREKKATHSDFDKMLVSPRFLPLFKACH